MVSQGSCSVIIEVKDILTNNQTFTLLEKSTMKKVQLDEFVVSGISVRTNNEKEMDPATGKIGPLWQEFFIASSKLEQSPSEAYGVYSGYESDWRGDYDITVGIEGDFAVEENCEITILAGTYICFEKKGAMPESALLLWQEIWEYFGKEGPAKRVYLTDFEKYVGLDYIQIFIGVQEGKI